MKVLDKIPNILTDVALYNSYKASLYPISNATIEYITEKLEVGNTTCLFSGSYRVDIDATYIEPRIFFTEKINWHKNTIFINDTANTNLLHYTISKLKSTNLCIINTAIFTKYRHINDILVDIDQFKNLVKKVIISMPIERFDFNRIKYSNRDICNMTNGIIVDNNLIICR